MKFAIDDNSLYSHYGVDGTIDFDDNFNKDNQPFNHKYINGEWVVDKASLLETLKPKLFTNLDELKMQLLHNETYSQTSEYESYKANILSQINNNRALLMSLEDKTAEELLLIYKSKI